MNGIFKGRWHGEAGYRQVLVIAFPLIFSTGAMALQHFIDRMFLAWYSPAAIAAAMPAGIVNFTIAGLFMGTATYVSTFVAQYYGSDQPDRIGPAMWQGMYVALIAAIVHLALIPLSDDFFNFVGHAPEVRVLESSYFKILSLGAGPIVGISALSAVFSGRGKTLPVMWVNLTGTLLNVVLNYVLIFGEFGFPEMGIKGAAWATVISSTTAFILFFILAMLPGMRKKYKTLSGWKPDFELFGRLLKYGLPNGIQFFLEHIGFTAFLLLVGRLGTTELAATNIAFNINMLAFMPMMGFGVAVSVLVGQNLGKDRPDLAEKCVYSALHLTFIFMSAIALSYLLIPKLFLWPYAAQADPVAFTPVSETTIILLRFVAIYCIFDVFSIIFSAGIKGAGDTRFTMIVIVFLSIFGLAVPVYIALVIMERGLMTAWAITTIHICFLGLIFFARFMGGKWKSMRVIETKSADVSAGFPAGPAKAFDH